MKKIELHDCGCVRTRPRDSRYYAARWRIYLTINYVVLRCLDCGKVEHFELRRSGIQISSPFPTLDMIRAESTTGANV